MEKQKILYQQARLHARGAAEMVLQMISASKGNHLCIYYRPYQDGQSSLKGFILLIYKLIIYILIPITSRFHYFCRSQDLIFTFSQTCFFPPFSLLSVLNYICRFCLNVVLLLPPGCLGPMVTCTLKLGISILNGGNVQVQKVRKHG